MTSPTGHILPHGGGGCKAQNCPRAFAYPLVPPSKGGGYERVRQKALFAPPVRMRTHIARVRKGYERVRSHPAFFRIISADAVTSSVTMYPSEYGSMILAVISVPMDIPSLGLVSLLALTVLFPSPDTI